ncbi:hypothetical protein MBLNU459_g0007t1 [Dothideomycetes sp. NU459]
MSLDPSDVQRSASPLSTGRSSPGPRLPRRVEDANLFKDKAVRRYAAGIERALSSFDAAQQEWADYIAFLARLLKAIQLPPPDLDALPHAPGVALRLSQCLNPSLPSGVHHKALDVYGSILSFLNRDTLGQSLYIYLPGLVPVLSFASLSVRPLYYTILEDYILVLSSADLRPATKSLILCLLPGIEDETSEDFERAFGVLDSLRNVFNRDPVMDTASGHQDGFFWQCFFLAVITNPSRRQGALAYLARKLPSFTPSKPSRSENGSLGPSDVSAMSSMAEAVITPEPGLLVRCFAAGLQDPQMLVQRGFLDLLVTNLPLHSPVFQNNINVKDVELITTAAVSAVLRRDMSLNRRLWSWFLGPDQLVTEIEEGQPQSPTDTRLDQLQGGYNKQAMYFRSYGATALERAIMAMLEQGGASPSERARPFRICLSLMDRWEVGGFIVPKILLPALRSAYDYSLVGSPAQVDEVIRSASLFFDGVESSLIWSRLIEVLVSALQLQQGDQVTSEGSLAFLQYVIDRFDVREEEMLLRHIPNTILILFAELVGLVHSGQKQSARLLPIALGFANKLLRSLPPRALQTSQSDTITSSNWGPEQSTAITSTVLHRYTKDMDEASEWPPTNGHMIAEYIIQNLAQLFKALLDSTTLIDHLGLVTEAFCSVITKIEDSKAFRSAGLYDSFRHALSQSAAPQEAIDQERSFLVVNCIMSLIIAANSGHCAPLFSHDQILGLQADILGQLWLHLSPYRPRHHVEVVRLIWQLEGLTREEHRVEARLGMLVAQQSEGDGPEVAGRFTVLWEHTMHSFTARSEATGRLSRRSSALPQQGEIGAKVDPEKVLTRPLFLLLDSLQAEGTGAADVVLAWLQELSSLDRIFHILLSRLRDDLTVYHKAARRTSSRRTQRNTCQSLEDILFCMKHLRNIIRHPSQHTWFMLANLQMNAPTTEDAVINGMELLARTCLESLAIQDKAISSSLHHVALTILQALLSSSHTPLLIELKIEDKLIALLTDSLAGPIESLQTVYLQSILKSLRVRAMSVRVDAASGDRPSTSGITHPSVSADLVEKPAVYSLATPPVELLNCLRVGLSSSSSRMFLEHWIDFLDEVLPLYADAVFANLLPLVECICKQVAVAFNYLKDISQGTKTHTRAIPISALSALLQGLELVLAHVHRQFQSEEVSSPTVKSPEQTPGFFGNMVSGVFSGEGASSKTSRNNSRLTMILSFQDAIRTCFSIWAWASYSSDVARLDPSSAATTSLNALKLRNRTRRILEHLFEAEELECLETLVLIWSRPPKSGSETDSGAVFSLLLVLDGSRPKNTVPVIINALYSRTNIDALDLRRRSSLTSDLSTTEIVTFLLNYTRAIEDDATDEIWTECTIFLKDVLSNPLPHRQILPALLEYTVLLAEKIDNTNFGEQRKMRRELGDIFLRLLTATFTVRPISSIVESSATSSTPGTMSDLIASLLYVTPKLQTILQSNDRVLSAANTMSTSLMSPAFHAKSFPENLSIDILRLFEHIEQQSPTAKPWKKDIGDAFNNPKILSCSADLIEDGWFPVLRKWALSDKDRMPELLSRLTAPSTAGIMFGVGANAARLEADRKTQLTLRKAVLLILACEQDTFMNYLNLLLEKVVDLCAADPSSSPSSATRADVFMVFRAVILSFSQVHLSALWPILNSTVQTTIESCLPNSTNRDTSDNLSLLQACKLLDLLAALTPDEFQLHEWLYITDTIDAVYRPADWKPTALTDEINEALGVTSMEPSSYAAPVLPPTSQSSSTSRRPFLSASGMDGADIKAMARDDFVRGVLQPFFGQLSMYAYEATYGMGTPDVEACRRTLLIDVLDERTMA